MNKPKFIDFFREALIIGFNNKLRIFTVFVAVVIGSAVAAIMTPKLYTSHASVLLKIGREHIYASEVGSVNDLSRYNPNEVVNSEVQILNSADLAIKVLEDMGIDVVYPQILAKESESSPLDPLKDKLKSLLSPETYGAGSKDDSLGKTPLDRALVMFRDDLTVASVKDSNVIHLYYTNRDSNVAAQVLETLLKHFVEKHVEVFSDPRSTFLAEQVEAYRNELATAESALQDFTQAHQLFNVEEQVRLLLNQRREFEDQLKNTEIRLAELDQALRAVTERLRTVPRIVSLDTETGSEPVRAAKERLLELELREQTLLNTYKESSRFVTNVRREIAQVEKFLVEQQDNPLVSTRTGRNDVYQELELQKYRYETEREALKGKRDNAATQLAKINEELPKLTERRKTLAELERAVASANQTYRSYSTKEEDARIRDALDQKKITNVRVIQDPTIPKSSIGMKRRDKVMLGGILGILLGFGLALLKSYREGEIISGESVRTRLALPVLATIPKVD